MEVSTPADDGLTDDADLEVVGRASPDATVSVNGLLTSRGPEGEFTLDLQLDEGPNLLEIIATDLTGRHQEIVRTVIYVP